MAFPLHIDINKVAAERCRREGGLAFFVKEFWDVIVPNPLIWNWHMQVLCDEIQRCDEKVFKREHKLWDLCVNVPPGTSKTLILSVFSTCWEFARMPSIKVFVGSFSDAAVAGIADQIKLIMRSEKYQQWFPEVDIRRDRDALHNFKTTVNGEFYAFTVGGTITSKHADVLKVDDPLNPKEAATDAGLKAANDFFSQTLPSRKVDKLVTPTYLVMQRLHVNDPSGMMINKKGGNVRHICLPAEINNIVRPKEYASLYINGYLDPVRLGPAQLKELKIDLGAYNYAGQIDQQPVPAGGIIWQKWFKEVEDWDWPVPKWGEAFSTDWDLAYTEKETNAASAYITTFKYKNKIWIEDFGWDWLEFPALIKWMKTKQGPHYIEAKACFVAGTLVRTSSGLKAIDKIKVGERVLSFNLQKQKPEFKKVLYTFVFHSLQYTVKLCIFTFSNGSTIKCTANHEFYINGNWITASDIAWRIMGMGAGNEQPIPDFEHGQTYHNELQKPIRKRTIKGHETGLRCQRVFANNACNQREVQDTKTASIGRASIYSNSRRKFRGKPYQQHSFGQQGSQFGMGYKVRKSNPFSKIKSERRIQEGIYKGECADRIEGAQFSNERTNGKRDQAEIHSIQIHKKDAGRRIRHQHLQRGRYYFRQRLEACEIDCADIVNAQIIECTEPVFDLHVEGNFNYCITSQNIIVHNSGKSAKQTLTDQGVIAVEVPVPGGSDKEARARMATPIAEAGMVCIKKSMAEKMYNDSKQGILFFPRGQFADLADVVAQCLLRQRNPGNRIMSENGDDLDEVFDPLEQLDY